MAAITKKRITDDIENILTKFRKTDETRYDNDWLSNKVDQIRAELIVKEYHETGIIDRNWLTDMGLTTFYPVNFADDPSISYCCDNVSKCTLPNTIPLSKDGIDLGVFALMSACGTKEYLFQPMSSWAMIKIHPIKSKFGFYDRINTAIYVNKEITSLRPLLILASPEDGYIINSTPVLSGSLVAGTVYIVKGAQILYKGTPRAVGSTFTADATANYTGNGLCYPNVQLQALSITKPYPVSADMARMITLEIITKEFKIEEAVVSDILNDSVDDQQNK